ncbi:MAG: organomercurial lyase [Candidatus Hydrogenedentales bacterium]|jgi:thioredoxin 1
MAESEQMTKSGSGIVVKLAIVVILAAAVAGVMYAKGQSGGQNDAVLANGPSTSQDGDEKESTESEAVAAPVQTAEAPPTAPLPRLVDLGADKCVPCKMMAPILEELKKESAGKLDVLFIDVWKNPEAGKAYNLEVIPTQIFYDATGKELYRHEGFFAKEDILAKWKEFGVDLLSAAQPEQKFSRWEPAKPDDRPKDTICYLCDGDINPKTRAVMKTAAGDVAFCTAHCYLITYASLTEETKTHDNALVTDWVSGSLVPAKTAVYIHGVNADGYPTIKAFSDEASAKTEQQASGGNLLSWAKLEEKELATRCAFCDRPVYPEDASIVRVDGMQTWGCCEMCALGVAARTGKDIEVNAKDALTGGPIRVKTLEGHVAELEPATAVAWAGARKDAEGKTVSTGCFKQAFFTNDANLKTWVDEHPTATGQQVSIEQALAAKMSLTPQQISKACKIGECAPK